MPSSLQLIVGLGNPGKEYAATRHNAGFMVVDNLVRRLNLEQAERTDLWQTWLWQTGMAKVLIVKPLTYMNKSGEAVHALMRFFKIGEKNTLVMHDDVDMPLGAIRLRGGGASGGHHGVESIHGWVGNNTVKRLKIGIGRPTDRVPVEVYVLRPCDTTERELLRNVIDRAGEIVVQLVTEGKDFAETTENVRV